MSPADLSQSSTSQVEKRVVVPAEPALAFEVFASRMGSWWPMATHKIGEADCVDVVVEPHVGGRWYERGADGRSCDWGRVLAWEPPQRLLLAWQLDAQWRFDPGLHTEVEVRFTALGPDRTEVTLTHRGLEVYGADALAMRDAFASPQGWGGMLEHYAEVAGQARPGQPDPRP